jgi:hypothetical protein
LLEGDGLGDGEDFEFLVDVVEGDGLAEADELAEDDGDPEGLAEPEADGDALAVESGFTVVAEGTCRKATALTETSPMVFPEEFG